jgi:ATP-dependent Lhr-like helicase
MTEHATRNAQHTLAAFLPAVQTWFGETFGEPTPPQALGWPAIQRGEHTLILSPTGSGKTLAAFLWGINDIWCEGQGTRDKEGVRLLYVSPLKALNNDVERNLRAPLFGIRHAAEEMGAPLPKLDVLVRTGDTPQSVRQRMVKHPPHVLITTPESLYLILTSPVARDMFRTVRTLIVDEIHTLVGNKRGVHLALSLERVEELTEQPIQRIGLSATQRPLEEVACFLGGYHQFTNSQSTNLPETGNLVDWEIGPRSVTIVDAGMVKAMDLKVITAVDDFSELPGGSIWPAIIPQVMDRIEAHRTTLIFANSRRQAERAADRLNDLWLARHSGRGDGPEALTHDGVAKHQGMFGGGTVGGPFRAHHGSVSKESRLHLETALKEGRLPALVGTSSLELGIDIGSVDLVIQLQSPGGVARGLQRVGRSGHLVGQVSVGRFFPTHREDVLETAAVVHAMRQGDVEPAYTPQNSLDVLAQQIVAMVSVQDWEAAALFDLVRRAYPYHRLTRALFDSVLDMLSGRYPSTAFRELRPRLAWDRVHDRLAALPGSRLLAIRNGGTIPDRGSFAAYLPDRKTRIGELDEEFVFETRPGDVFTLGASTWRVHEVADDRLIVTPAPGNLPRMPFWKGDALRRDYHLGQIYGRFRREMAHRITTDPEPEVLDWLQTDYNLDLRSAQNAVRYVARQIDVLGAISSDKTVIAELFTDPLGDQRLVIHSPFGARVNSPWALALTSAFRDALGPRPEVMVSDDGILFRFLETDREPPLNLLREMGPVEARERVLAELPDSAVFGAQFRMNAARALLLPPAKGGQKRTPFWLQRLRAKDLLAVARGFEDFPIIAETYRDCLRDVLDLAHLEALLRDIQAGAVEVVVAETVAPSPVAAGLLYDFINQYMYEWDQPKAERQMGALLMGRELLAQLLDEASLPDLLKPEAVRAVDEQLQYLADGRRARTTDELATVFLALGDLSPEEAAARSDGDGFAWVRELVDKGQVTRLEFLGGRYVLAEQADTYRAAFDLSLSADRAPTPGDRRRGSRLRSGAECDDARRTILRRVLSTHGPLTRDQLLARYPWPAAWLDPALAALVESGEAVTGPITSSPIPQSTEYCDRRNLERIHRHTLSLLRKEVEPVSVYAYADFLARWMHLHPAHRLDGPGALVKLLQQMRGLPAHGVAWERDLLPERLTAFDPKELEGLCERGELVWVLSGGKDPGRARVSFFFRGEGHLFLPPAPEDPDLSPAADEVLAFLKSEGACFFADLEAGTELPNLELTSALVELALNGLVTNDSLAALRGVLAWSAADNGVERKPLSSLDAELSAWRKEQAAVPRIGQRPERARLHRARRTVARRLDGAATLRWPGRWSLVHRFGVWGKELPFEERVVRQARQLLQSYGIVTRESLADWEIGDWGAIYRQFQMLEMRGEVRRGYFVQGLPGVQFALPEAVERLREWTRTDASALSNVEGLVLVNATDPANVFGPARDFGPLPGAEERENDPARFTRIPANYAVLLRGRPVLLLETGGERLTTLPDLSSETLKRALKLAVEHIGQTQRRLTLGTWNGEPILDSPAAPLVEEAGFRREALVYVWEGG